MIQDTIDKSRGFKPRSKVWFMDFSVNWLEIKFDNVLRASEQAKSKLRLSYVAVRYQKRNSRLNFRNF